MSTVFKAGHQSPDNPLEFILSDESADRVGDVIRASGWDLRAFKSNPVALFGHAHENIIGVWENVRIEDKMLKGALRLAKEGTSDLVDTVRSLIEQKVLKAVSVGFQPIEANPRNGGGYEFTKAALHEVSLVAVPANSNALAVKMVKATSPDLVNKLFVKPDELEREYGCGQSTHNLETPNLQFARKRLRDLGIDY